MALFCYLLVISLKSNTIIHMGKLIATDLDGTLFYPKKRIYMIKRKSLRFLRNHIDNGGKLVLVSGRNSEYLQKVVRRINRPVDVIGCNASFIISDGKLIRNVGFNIDKTKDVLKKIEEEFQTKGMFIMSEDNRFVIREKFHSLIYRMVYQIWNFFQGVYKEPSTVSKEQYNEIINSGKAKKIMVFFGVGRKNVLRSKEANKIIREKYGDVVEGSWSNEFIELSPAGCSKSEGLKYYLEYHKINHSDVYVVGDSGNDISMFEEFHENSFCMSHASLSVSKYAKHVIKHFSDLEKFIEQERK